ncbi:YbaB/EbfC family nucleoid-associated protein [Thermoanaerobacterium sp. DL9XJH110]|uniref:YbaB/EbfC family nucleoid-associated protein n=1 Tax=Thermoanaerobacterium sp. DL9XJH110 TaxID=3386643 RepID=UPI003BB5A517
MWQDMAKMAKAFQEEIVRMKKNLEEARFTGESDDQKVVVETNGLEEIVNVTFYMDEISPDSKRILEQSIVQATNKALTEARKSLQQKTRDLTGGLNFEDFR